MSPDGSLDNALCHPSNWHSIRPWAPSLSLAVREITSVSATFILSSNFSGEIDSSLASLGLEAAEDDPEHVHETTSSPTERKPNSFIADTLAKGLSVNVNGSAWPRAFIRIDDHLDEAVIIIYALMPGRQYDIELALAPVGQPSIVRRQQVTTEEESDHDTEVHTDVESPTLDNSTSSDPHSTPSTSPSRTVPGTPPNANATPQLTLEDRLSQLQHTLSALNAERDGILISLKSARRDAQKADSALRSEIDTLKRTSEKNAAGELRGKQKVLALQEALKRAQNSTKEMEEMTGQLQTMIPEVNTNKKAKENEHAKIKSEALRVKKEREEIEEKDKKRLEAMRTELAGLTNKLEKLGGKREKIESAIIPELEDKLKDVAKEIDDEELELMRLEMQDHQPHIAHDSHGTMNVQLSMDDSPPPYVPMQRIRHNSQPGHTGRPAPTPIQRPSQDGNSAQSSSNGLRSPTQGSHRPVQTPHTPQHGQSTHTPRSHSLNNQNHSSPGFLSNAQRRSSLKSNNTTTNGSGSNPTSNSATTSSPTPSSLTSSPTRTSPGILATASTLSSRAPAFEPSRSLGAVKTLNSNNHFHGHVGSNTTTSGFSHSHTPTAIPIRRPSGTFVAPGRPVVPSASKAQNSAAHPPWGGKHGHGHSGTR